MAGIGVRLNRIFEKNTLVADLIGFGYSTIVTVAPMFLVIGNIFLMGKVLGLAKVPYAPRELFSTTVLYMFIFSLLTTAPCNALLSRYMSDVIFEERYEDIMPCFYVGLAISVAIGCLAGIPFCIHEAVVGKVDVLYVFAGFCGYIACVLVFYAILYIQICKDYKKITIFFTVGMVVSFILSVILVYVFSFPVTNSMLVSLVVGFVVIACQEIAMIKRYFKKNSGRYRPVLRYFWKLWQLVVINTLYTLGLYIHNFVFWTTDIRMEVVNSFVCAPAYDMASCLAMFTNISATVILISRLEMNFRDKYKGYSEAVIGGRGVDIRNAQNRMFRQLASELMTLARIQFIISICVFLACVIFLPQYGFSGLVMQIYPCLAAGYFVLFLMYSAIIFLYYYNDLTGALAASIVFVLVTLFVSIYATGLSEKWYGIGVGVGSLAGWTVAYFRLRWVERHLDEHIFCRGTLIRYGKGEVAPSKVYSSEMRRGLDDDWATLPGEDGAVSGRDDDWATLPADGNGGAGGSDGWADGYGSARARGGYGATSRDDDWAALPTDGRGGARGGDGWADGNSGARARGGYGAAARDDDWAALPTDGRGGARGGDGWADGYGGARAQGGYGVTSRDDDWATQPANGRGGARGSDSWADGYGTAASRAARPANPGGMTPGRDADWAGNLSGRPAARGMRIGKGR